MAERARVRNVITTGSHISFLPVSAIPSPNRFCSDATATANTSKGCRYFAVSSSWSSSFRAANRSTAVVYEINRRADFQKATLHKHWLDRDLPLKVAVLLLGLFT